MPRLHGIHEYRFVDPRTISIDGDGAIDALGREVTHLYSLAEAQAAEEGSELPFGAASWGQFFVALRDGMRIVASRNAEQLLMQGHLCGCPKPCRCRERAAELLERTYDEAAGRTHLARIKVD